jgi:NitT/TauT family transport system substrate-binding protein
VLPAASFISFSLIVLLAFSSGHADASPEILQLGYTNAEGAKIPVFVGKEQGIFERHGLDLRLARVSPGTLGVPKLLSGEIHLFLGNSGPVVEAVAREQAPLAVIASLGIERFAIYTRPDIGNVEALKGGTFGVSTPGASQDRIATRALKKLGLEPGKDIRVLATGLNSSIDRLGSLSRGEVDAVAATAGDLSQLEPNQAAKIRKLIDLADLGIFVSGADVTVARGYIRTDRETVRRFLRALEESLRLAGKRPDLVGATYEKYLGVANPAAVEMKVKEYYAGNPPARPLPNKQAIESHLEELREKYPGSNLREVSAYIDESLY